MPALKHVSLPKAGIMFLYSDLPMYAYRVGSKVNKVKPKTLL